MPLTAVAPGLWTHVHLMRMPGGVRIPARMNIVRLYGKDRPALKKSVEKVLAWDFVRVLPAHGAPFETADTRTETRTAAAWFLE